jgi:hypothetical protein
MGQRFSRVASARSRTASEFDILAFANNAEQPHAVGIVLQLPEFSTAAADSPLLFLEWVDGEVPADFPRNLLHCENLSDCLFLTPLRERLAAASGQRVFKLDCLDSHRLLGLRSREFFSQLHDTLLWNPDVRTRVQAGIDLRTTKSSGSGQRPAAVLCQLIPLQKRDAAEGSLIRTKWTSSLLSSHPAGYSQRATVLPAN